MRKLKDKNTRALIRLGKASLAVTLPTEIVKELRWKEKQKVVVKKVRGGFLIKDWFGSRTRDAAREKIRNIK